MWQFLITGYIPGTNIQITYTLLLLVVLLLTSLLVGARMIATVISVQRNISKGTRVARVIQHLSL
ncbi:MAG TPA: hypothetical protein PKD20_01740 [Candidatus Saccharibacteria bacterium]|jgi:hypothetical protein|nr:hypothetical protein [Candidatus Saccharibacteria bacterium]